MARADSLTIGVTTDAGVVPDGSEVVKGLRVSFDELRQASGMETRDYGCGMAGRAQA
jgi:hypothetical protein